MHSSLVVSNPFNDADADIPGQSGLRAQLHHLLPRHTYFQVHILIHQVTNVPLVSGDFGVRWKFKNVHSPHRALLDIVKRKKGKGKARDDHDEDADSNSQGSTAAASLEHLPTGRVSPLPPDWTHTHPHLFSAPSSTSSSPFLPDTTASSSESTHSHASSSSHASSAPSLTLTPPQSTTPPILIPTPARPRGQTPFSPLKDHTATWDHPVSVIVRMDVERSSSALLLPSPLKLVITQREDPTAPPLPHKSPNTRLGAVYLDLAQYVNKGEVVRRYLLRESKTNALLKLTVHITHISGPTNFNAPPLPKGEILNGISGIILENEVYLTRPKGLDLYGPYYDLEELECDLLAHESDDTDEGEGEDDTEHSTPTISSKPKPKLKEKPRSFDSERLPLAYGPKTTETLIEALFNPVKTTEKRRESPFTILVSSVDDHDEGGGGAPIRLEAGGRENGLSSPLHSDSPRRSATRSGSGVGAGLGIMGLGLGMGIGMGVGFGVEGRGGKEKEKGDHLHQRSSVRTASSREEYDRVSLEARSVSTTWSSVSVSRSVSGDGSVEGGGDGDGDVQKGGGGGGVRGWWRTHVGAGLDVGVGVGMTRSGSRPNTPLSASASQPLRV